MTDERYKQIMNDLGMPNSRSLLSALQQVANEAWQECAAAEREACAEVCEAMHEEDRPSDYAYAIRARSNAGDKPPQVGLD